MKNIKYNTKKYTKDKIDSKDKVDSKKLVIGDFSFNSRLFMGTSMFPNQKIMLDSLENSGTEFVTISIRRISLEKYQQSPLELIKDKYKILPNTAGCQTAKDAIFTAKLAREALQTNYIKLEVIADRETLYPDTIELLKAAEVLIKEGFNVLAYSTDDIITCRKLADMGCVAVMPLGSPIGSGQGICNPYNIELICNKIDIPIILDAGIGSPIDALHAMELGCDGVLMNSAVAKSYNPPKMAKAMKHAVISGRLGFESGRMPKKKHAEASSPQMGLIG